MLDTQDDVLWHAQFSGIGDTFFLFNLIHLIIYFCSKKLIIFDCQYCFLQVLQTAVWAYHDFKVTRLQHIVEMGVVELQQIICDFKLHLLTFTLLQMDTLEALQLLHWTGNACYHIVDIQLNNLITIIVASVRYGDRCCAPVKNDVAIVEGGVAQTIAKRIERIISYVQIVTGEFCERIRALSYRPARRQMVVIERFLSCGLRHRDGQFATGYFVAENHIANGITSLTASEPHIEDGRDMCLLPRHHRRTACKVEQYDRFVEFQNALIEADIEKLDEILSDDFRLTQSPNRSQIKKEFISEIDDGSMDVSKSDIMDPTILFDDDESASLISKVRLTAKVNGRELRWISNTVANFRKIDGIWLVVGWDS